MIKQIVAVAIAGLFGAALYAANKPVTVQLKDAKDQSAGTDEVARESCAQADSPRAKKSFREKNQESCRKENAVARRDNATRPQGSAGRRQLHSRAEIPPGRD